MLIYVSPLALPAANRYSHWCFSVLLLLLLLVCSAAVEKLHRLWSRIQFSFDLVRT